jgi:imidazolonepropionase-like amidohydrolase
MRVNRSAGATHAKILATGLNSTEEIGRVGGPQFSPEEFSALFAEARDLGVGLMVHGNGPVGRWNCLPSREGTLEHGFWLGDQDLEAMAGAGTPWVPTLGAWEGLSARSGLEPHQRAVIKATGVRHREEVRRGGDLGIPVLSGTDAGSPGVGHGSGLVEELQRLEAVFGGAQEALAASTFRARAYCEREFGRALGGLELGRPAGFLWLREDPALRLATLTSPKGVFLGGTWSPLHAEHER